MADTSYNHIIFKIAPLQSSFSPAFISSLSHFRFCLHLSSLLLLYYLAVVHLWISLPDCLAAAWCIVTFCNEPFLIPSPAPGFLQSLLVVISFPSSCTFMWVRKIIIVITMLNIFSQGHHPLVVCTWAVLVFNGCSNEKKKCGQIRIVLLQLCPWWQTLQVGLF